MELRVYDTALTPLGVVDEITSLLWTRRYWSPGEFKLLAPFTPHNAKLLVKYHLIGKRGDKEVAQITYININKNAYGLEEIEVQGRFISAWLDRRIVLNQIRAAASSQSNLYRIVTENITSPADSKRKIPLIGIEANPPNLGGGTVNYVSEPYISCLAAAEGIAKAAKLGFRIETDFRAGKHTFVVYKGREMTTDQTALPPCVFSQEFDNIYEQEYTNSVENMRNAAYVGGEEKQGQPRQIVELGTVSGLDRIELFVNASDITQTYRDGDADKTMTAAEYSNALTQRGNKELEQHTETLHFNSEINGGSNLVYKEDFDIGDRVTCIDRRWSVRINVRITEITESYQQEKNHIDITFGESLPVRIVR